MEFVMIAVAATLAAATPAESPQAQSSAQRHFADQLACEQAASTTTPPPGTKLVCVPAGGGSLIHTAH